MSTPSDTKEISLIVPNKNEIPYEETKAKQPSI
jgi:hypothetical protein